MSTRRFQTLSFPVVAKKSGGSEREKAKPKHTTRKRVVKGVSGRSNEGARKRGRGKAATVSDADAIPAARAAPIESISVEFKALEEKLLCLFGETISAIEAADIDAGVDAFDSEFQAEFEGWTSEIDGLGDPSPASIGSAQIAGVCRSVRWVSQNWWLIRRVVSGCAYEAFLTRVDTLCKLAQRIWDKAVGGDLPADLFQLGHPAHYRAWKEIEKGFTRSIRKRPVGGSAGGASGRGMPTVVTGQSGSAAASAASGESTTGGVASEASLPPHFTSKADIARHLDVRPDEVQRFFNVKGIEEAVSKSEGSKTVYCRQKIDTWYPIYKTHCGNRTTNKIDEMIKAEKSETGSK